MQAELNDNIFGSRWTQLQEQANADTANDTAATVYIRGYRQVKTSPYTCYIDRGAFPFDCSVIPVNAILISAQVGLGVKVKYSGTDETYSYYTVVESQQASPTALVIGDYDNIGDAVDNPTKLSNDLYHDDITASSLFGAWNYWTLNSNGLALLQTAITNQTYVQFGVRQGNDQEDVEPTGTGTLFGSYIQVITASIVSGKKPVLIVKWRLPQII